MASLRLRALLIILGYTVRKIYKSSREFLRPLECGFNTYQETRLPVSLQFFVFAVIFVIFDIELIFLVPIIKLSSTTLEVVIFFIILVNLLTVGLVLE